MHQFITRRCGESRVNYKLRSLKISGIYGIRPEDLHTLRGLIDHNTIQLKKNKTSFSEKRTAAAACSLLIETVKSEEPAGGGMFVKVMTDEQMEVLLKQIALYATICEQLVELHKSLTSQTISLE